MATSSHRLISAAAHEAVQSIAESVFDWLQARCQADRDYAFGNKYETTWSKEISEFLVEQGRIVKRPRNYPGSRNSCDIVGALSEGQELWLEVKGAWLTTQHRIDTAGRVRYLKNPSFRKHLFHERESALKDLTVKLPIVIGANSIGSFLLLGFDAYTCSMDDAIEELVAEAGLADALWVRHYREWSNPHDNQYRIRCWLWYQ